MKTQKNPWGCGLYSVANTLNLDNFITEERLKISKKGNTIGQLSKWLQEDGHNIYIDTLYYNHVGKRLPNSACSYQPEKEERKLYLPILLNVTCSENGLRHMVGGRIDQEGVLYLFDSLKSRMIETTLHKVNRKYHTVFGLFIFMNTHNGDYIFME